MVFVYQTIQPKLRTFFQFRKTEIQVFLPAGIPSKQKLIETFFRVYLIPLTSVFLVFHEVFSTISFLNM